MVTPNPPNEFGGCVLRSRMNPAAKEQASANGADTPFSSILVRLAACGLFS
jgi:hypothetical protein